MFYHLATPKNIARATFFACVKQQMIFNFFKNITPQILLAFASQAMYDRLAAFRALQFGT